MLREWGRFVTAVKLNRGLKTSNYDQLYAYLKQHEAHVNENKMMLERYNQHAIDPLAFVSNDLSRITPTDDLIENLTKTVALLTQSYKTHLPQTNNQLRTSSNTKNQATVQNGRVVVQNVQGRQNRGQGNYAKGAIAAGNGGVQNRVGNASLEYFKDKMLLMQAQENGVILDEEQLLFIVGGQTNTFDDDVDEAPVQDLALNKDNVFQADQSDPIYDEAGPSYDSDIISEIAQCVSANEQNKVVNVSLTTELVRYKEQVELYEKKARFELTEREQNIDEQLRISITDRNYKEESLKKELHSVKMQLNSTINHNKSMIEEVTSLKRDFKQKENKYLKDFLDMKALKEKVEDKLFKQD
ncbi:hypothetical protein Tco_1424076 [Tanacetum coccineum]